MAPLSFRFSHPLSPRPFPDPPGCVCVTNGKRGASRFTLPGRYYPLFIRHYEITLIPPREESLSLLQCFLSLRLLRSFIIAFYYRPDTIWTTAISCLRISDPLSVLSSFFALAASTYLFISRLRSSRAVSHRHERVFSLKILSG